MGLNKCVVDVFADDMSLSLTRTRPADMRAYMSDYMNNVDACFEAINASTATLLLVFLLPNFTLTQLKDDCSRLNFKDTCSFRKLHIIY